MSITKASYTQATLTDGTTTGTVGALPPVIKYEGNKGEIPVMEALSVAPSDSKFVTPIVRTQAFVALTPNEIELNREVAYLQNNPIVTS